MEWFKRVTPGLEAQTKKELPDGLWIKCDRCGEILYKKELERNRMVCTGCAFHFRMDSGQYIALLADEGSFEEFNENLSSADPLHFKDSKKYTDRLEEAMAKTGLKEAVRTGECTLAGLPVVMAIMDFRFIGGSMGSVVGEKVSRAIDRAVETRRPLIILSASGGARMQEGALSLMQMAKTAAKLALLAEARIPFISILTDPTAGGTTASFSMLGDVIIAEPGAFIGFAGPRVIKQTIGQDLPEGFQRAEFVQEHGFVDMIVDRRQLKEQIERILVWFVGPARKKPRRAAPKKKSAPEAAETVTFAPKRGKAAGEKSAKRTGSSAAKPQTRKNSTTKPASEA
ncbi:MAG TPA: acetyl-CoA carboxylase, carboxyltransferase subunit beta [bacterium]|nr:acetyl-CoA carboxylase, carboxyltransferase subunit beta [bacterium]HPG84161.1 acetyl-CoA carboxylase, carboxyltransferase subunit beta [bacterium]